MTRTVMTVNEREDPLSLGGGDWASSIPVRTWSSHHGRGRGAPMFKQWYRNGPKAAYEPPRKQPKQQHGRGPWFQPPRRPYWAVYSNWARCGGPWCPPPMAFQNPLCPAQMIRAYGLHPLCLCCCSCWSSPWNPGWERHPGRRKRWGRRGRGLPRHPHRSFRRNPPTDLSKQLRPVSLNGWRAPGMNAPPNTTQFIMNQVYEDMRQEKLERQQAAMRAQQAQEGDSCHGGSTANDVSPCGVEEDPQLLENLYGFMQDPYLDFSPAPVQQNQSPDPQQVEEEEKNDGDEEEECDTEVYDGKEENDEEEEDGETEDEEGDEDVKEADNREESEEDQEEEEMLEEEGLEGREQREEEKFLSLGMPLSILVEEEEERENFINYDYLSSEHIVPTVPEEDLFMISDINQ